MENEEPPIDSETAVEEDLDSVPASPSEPSRASTPPPVLDTDSEVSIKDPLFPFTPNFALKSRKEKEMLFLKAFEEQVLFIRNKELKSINAPVEPLLTDEQKEQLIHAREQFFEEVRNNEQRQTITRKVTEATSQPPPRVDVDHTPTFNPLLNVNFNSKFALLDQFKAVLSDLLMKNRIAKRTKMVTQHLMSLQTNAVKSLQERIEEETEMTAHSLLSLNIQCSRDPLKFADPYIMEPPTSPEFEAQPQEIAKPFKLYVPGIVERFRLTQFPRTDVSAYVSAPIAMPEEFPVVREEQPIRERIVPSIDLTDEELKEGKAVGQKTEAELVLPKVVQHPREVSYYSFDPAYCLRPQPIELPDLPDEIGRASLLSLPLSEYEKMAMTGKTNTPVAPFEFFGVPKFDEAGLAPMSAADPVDLRELEADDDIDGIDVQPKVRPITDFLTKPVSGKNKSHELIEGVAAGQAQWIEREKTAVSDLIEKLTAINRLMRDQTLTFSLSDLQDYTK